MQILDAYDLTESFRDAAELAGCSHHTVARYVRARDAGQLTGEPARRPMLIDEFLLFVEEWMEQSHGEICADRAHRWLHRLGYRGSERTTRRAVGQVAELAGRPGAGAPTVAARAGQVAAVRLGRRPDDRRQGQVLFCARLAWSRYRVVLPLLDETLQTLIAALDTTLRRIGGAPSMC